MAAVAAAHPEVMGSREERIRVILGEGPTLGQTLPTPEGSPVKIGEEVNKESFESQFLKTLLD